MATNSSFKESVLKELERYPLGDYGHGGVYLGGPTPLDGLVDAVSSALSTARDYGGRTLHYIGGAVGVAGKSEAVSDTKEEAAALVDGCGEKGA